MRYLVASDAGSMHVYNFIKYVLEGRGWEIVILSHSVKSIPSEYIQYYRKNNIKIISAANSEYATSTSKISKLKKLLYKYRELRKIGTIDVFHIHFLNTPSSLLYLLIKNKVRKLIVSFWGSDILLLKKISFLPARVLDKADLITCTVLNTYEIFTKKSKSKYLDKTKIIRFVCSGITILKGLKNTCSKSQALVNLNIPKDKITLTLGYNALPAQRHLECIQLIKSLPEKIKNELFIIVPLQYGRINETYIKKLKEEISNIGVDFLLLEEYFNSTQMAYLALATDIYINVRPTDAFSNTMKEMLYAGAIMIQGEWLTYKELDQINWPRIKLQSIDSLNEGIKKALATLTSLDYKRMGCEYLGDIMSGESVREQWDSEFRLLDIK